MASLFERMSRGLGSILPESFSDESIISGWKTMLSPIGHLFVPPLKYVTDAERLVAGQTPNASPQPRIEFPTPNPQGQPGVSPVGGISAPGGTAPTLGGMTPTNGYDAIGATTRDVAKMYLDAFNQSNIRGPKESGLAEMYNWQNKVMGGGENPTGGLKQRDQLLAERGIAANSWGPNRIQLAHLGYNTPELQNQYYQARATQERNNLEAGLEATRKRVDEEIRRQDPRYQMVNDPERDWEDNKAWIDSLPPNDPRVQEVNRRMAALGGGLGSMAEKVAVARVRNGQVGEYITERQQPTDWKTGIAPWKLSEEAAEAKTIDGVPVRRAIPIAESKSTLNTIPSTKTPTAASVPSSSYNPNNLPTIPLTAEMKAFLDQGPKGPQPQTQFLDRNAVNQLVANQGNSNVQPTSTQHPQSLLPNPYLAWMNDIQAAAQNLAHASTPATISALPPQINAPLAGPYASWMNDVQATKQNLTPSPTTPTTPTQYSQSLVPNPYAAWMNDVRAAEQNLTPSTTIPTTPNAAPHINSQTAGNFVLNALSTGQPIFEGPIAPAYGPNAAKESYDLLEPVYRFFNGLGTSLRTAPTNAPLAGPYSPWMNDVQAATQGLTPRPTPPEAQVNARYYPYGPQPSAPVSPAVMKLLNEFYKTNAPQPPPIPFEQWGQFHFPRRSY